MASKKQILVGGVPMGGGAPMVIQSMCNTKTHDVESTVKQILALEQAGCQVVRLAIPDMNAAEAIPAIKQQVHIPLVADIHFDYKLALAALKGGIDKIRINPGNIGDKQKVKAVADACKAAGVPIICSMGTGNKIDPTRLEVADIYKTSVCPLARVMRTELRKRGVKKLKVLFSTEQPLPLRQPAEPQNGKVAPASNSFVPACAGLIIAGEVIKGLLPEGTV